MYPVDRYRTVLCWLIPYIQSVTPALDTVDSRFPSREVSRADDRFRFLPSHLAYPPQLSPIIYLHCASGQTLLHHTSPSFWSGRGVDLLTDLLHDQTDRHLSFFYEKVTPRSRCRPGPLHYRLAFRALSTVSAWTHTAIGPLSEWLSPLADGLSVCSARLVPFGWNSMLIRRLEPPFADWLLVGNEPGVVFQVSVDDVTVRVRSIDALEDWTSLGTGIPVDYSVSRDLWMTERSPSRHLSSFDLKDSRSGRSEGLHPSALFELSDWRLWDTAPLFPYEQAVDLSAYLYPGAMDVSRSGVATRRYRFDGQDVWIRADRVYLPYRRRALACVRPEIEWVAFGRHYLPRFLFSISLHSSPFASLSSVRADSDPFLERWLDQLSCDWPPLQME